MILNNIHPKTIDIVSNIKPDDKINLIINGEKQTSLNFINEFKQGSNWSTLLLIVIT